MKVIHIVEASATGTLSMLALLANAQIAQKNNVEVIYSYRPETPVDIKSFFSPEIILTNIQMYSASEKLKSLKKIRSRLDISGPDIVIMHSSFAGFLGRLSSIGILQKAKFFYIPHCISFMRKDIGFLKHYLFVLFEWFAAIKKADYIACSESERSAISKYIPFRSCHLVENAVAINTADFTPNKRTTKTVITVGQIRPQKGPEDFSAIAKKALAIDSEIKFLWVGDGEPQYKKLLEQSGVTVLGWMQKDNVLKSLHSADIYLSSAKWEGMPVSLIEAIYSGLPLIASKCAGNIDVIVNGSTGWIYNSVNEAALKVVEVANDKHMANTVAESAFDLAKERFSTQRYLSDMNKLMLSYSQ